MPVPPPATATATASASASASASATASATTPATPDPVDPPAIDPARHWSQGGSPRHQWVAGHWDRDPENPRQHAWIYGHWALKPEYDKGYTEIPDTTEWRDTRWTFVPHAAVPTVPGHRYEPGSWDCRAGENVWTPGRWYKLTEPREPRHESVGLVMALHPAPGRTDLRFDMASMVLGMVRVGSWVVWRNEDRTLRLPADGTGCLEVIGDVPLQDPTHPKNSSPPVMKLAVSTTGSEERLFGLTRSEVLQYAADGTVTRHAVTGLTEDPLHVIADGDSLYVTLFRGDAIVRVPIAGGSAETVAELGRGAGAGGVMLATQGNALYYATYGGTVGRLPLGGGKARVLGRFKHVRGLVADDRSVFVMGGGAASADLVRIDLASGARTVLGTHIDNGGYLAQDRDWIYVPVTALDSKSSVVRYAKRGKSVETIASGLLTPTELEIDGKALLVNDNRGIVRIELH